MGFRLIILLIIISCVCATNTKYLMNKKKSKKIQQTQPNNTCKIRKQKKQNYFSNCVKSPCKTKYMAEAK